MKLLVLGGTMFLSQSIAVRALARGHEVIVAARGHSGPPPDGARFVKIDRSEPATFDALGDETFDAIVDISRLAGHVGPVVEALADRVGHWTFVSTISVYADHTTPKQRAGDADVVEPAADDSVDADMEQYGHNKVASENLVRRGRGDDAFIVRPGLIVGPGDPSYRFGYWPDRFADGGEILAPGSPDDPVQWIDVRDQADWIIDAAETGLVGTFDGVGSSVPRSRFLADIAAGMDVEPRLTWVPQETLVEHDVRPWAGERALPLWVPVPEYAGLMDLDASASVAAGLKTRSVAESARDWYESEKGKPRDPAKGLSRSAEAEILAAWHAG